MSEMGFLFREARQIRPQVILTSADKFPIVFCTPSTCSPNAWHFFEQDWLRVIRPMVIVLEMCSSSRPGSDDWLNGVG
jgi:hypothetical protein